MQARNQFAVEGNCLFEGVWIWGVDSEAASGCVCCFAFCLTMVLRDRESKTSISLISIYLESPKTFYFCVFVFGLIFLRFCSKNAFLEMRTQKKVQSESSSGRVRHGRLKTPFGRKKTRFGRRKKVSGHCLRRI